MTAGGSSLQKRATANTGTLLSAGPDPIGYAALCGVWFVLCATNVALFFMRPGSGWGIAAIIAGAVGLLFCLWLSGFRIRITDTGLEYRDGFFHLTRIKFSEIGRIRTVSADLGAASRGLKIPRISVEGADFQTPLLINPKPFRTGDLRKFWEIMSGKMPEGAVEWSGRGKGSKRGGRRKGLA